MRHRTATPPTAVTAVPEPLLELVVVSTDEQATLELSVRRLHDHLANDAHGRPGDILLTIADHASTDRTGAIADAIAAELDAAGPIPVRAVHLPERLGRTALRQRWASSPAQVAAFVTLRPDTDLRAVLAPLAGRTRPPSAPARPGVLSRRTALATLGGAGLVLLAACSGKSASSGAAGPTSTTTGSTTSTAAPATSAAAGLTTTTTGAATTTSAITPTNVALAPEMTEGPYYLDLDLVRSDVREDRTGATFNLNFIVMNVAGQTPVAGAAVDIWHCDAEGIYSGFVAASTGSNGGSGGGGGAPGGGGPGDAGGGGATSTDDSTFLRGTQVSGSDGRVSFTTTYPGWYTGRTVHIHVKVHAGGKEIHTGQLFFDDDFTDALYASTAPYSSRDERTTRNDDDGIFGDGGTASTLEVTKSADRYASTMAVGVKTA
jgi:protocatechuate 3,4-dioxygenase beta subunit